MCSPCSVYSGVMVKEEGEKNAMGFRWGLTNMGLMLMAADNNRPKETLGLWTDSGGNATVNCRSTADGRLVFAQH